jgi:hypothetical protein
MKGLLLVAGCVLVANVVPALGQPVGPPVPVTEPWDNAWYVNGDRGFQINEGNVATFSPTDARLGPNAGNNGTDSGGMHWDNSSGTNDYTGGDNARAMLNMDMNVPAGEYYFEVTLDHYMYWDHDGSLPLPQAWGLGQEWYIGDSADMDYGDWQHNSSPPGPWRGGNWGDNNFTKLGSMWNGSDQEPPELRSDQNGIWFPGLTFTQTVDPVSTILTDGTITFRSVGRWKDGTGISQRIAMDNLSITLTPVNGESAAQYVFTEAFPEPATALLMGLGALPLLRRRRR